MSQIKQYLQKLFHPVLVGLAVGLVWLQCLPVNSAMAKTTSTDYNQKSTNETNSVLNNNERSQKVLACLPENLGKAQQDLQRKVTDNLESLGIAQLDRIFDLRRSPELKEAKREFVKCLENKGILATR